MNEKRMEQNITLERPFQVTKAVYILYISLGLVTIRAFLDLSLPGGKFSEGIGMLVQVPLFALLYYVIAKGKNWGRITLTILFFLGVIGLVFLSFREPPVSDLLSISKLGLDIAGMGFDLVALVLLFQPDSSVWFKAVSGPQRNPFKIILPMLRNTDQPVLSYVWRAWLIDMIPTLVIGVIVFGIVFIVSLAYPNKLVSLESSPGRRFLKEPPWSLVFGAVILGPWIESCLMWPILGILKRIFKHTIWVAVASAVVWGVLHSTASLLWGFGVAWSFFVLSLCFLEWSKISTGWAVTVTSLIHMCHNAVPTLFIVLLTLSGALPAQLEKTAPQAAHRKAHVAVSASKKTTSPQPSIPVNAHKEAGNLTRRSRYKMFRKAIPESNEVEYKIAYEDLWPDWKKNVAPNGTWKEFLLVYKQFIQWWKNRGSPMEPWHKLWNDFIDGRH